MTMVVGTIEEIRVTRRTTRSTSDNYLGGACFVFDLATLGSSGLGRLRTQAGGHLAQPRRPRMGGQHAPKEFSPLDGEVSRDGFVYAATVWRIAFR